jgi:predicted DNA-binding protein with PD1-like motif
MKHKRLNLGQDAFVLVFGTGDEAVAGLLEFAGNGMFESAFFYGIGAFERVTLAFFDLAKKEYEHIPIEEQVEVMSLIGNISQYNGEAKIHAHAVVGKRDGSALGGHLLEGIVRPTLEVFLFTSETALMRSLDTATNLPLLDPEAG